MNKSFLIGRLTKKPEIRYTETNNAICSFSIAIDRSYTNKEGKKETDFINIKVFGKQAENVSKYCDKGSLVAIDGRIQTGSYEKEGKKVYIFEVVADRVQFLDSKPKEEIHSETPEETKIETKKLADNVFESFGEQIEINDEDLAF